MLNRRVSPRCTDRPGAGPRRCCPKPLGLERRCARPQSGQRPRASSPLRSTVPICGLPYLRYCTLLKELISRPSAINFSRRSICRPTIDRPYVRRRIKRKRTTLFCLSSVSPSSLVIDVARLDSVFLRSCAVCPVREQLLLPLHLTLGDNSSLTRSSHEVIVPENT